jgi:dihydrofolate reductase
MTRVLFDISMSLDGFITEPGAGGEHGPEEDPGRLHDWMFDGRTDADGEIVAEVYARIGAVVIGRRMFDLGFGPWGDEPPFHMPVFVVTHAAREPMAMKGGTTYTFVTSSVEDALAQASAAAGGKDIGVWGGADIARQCLAKGLLDEVQIHLVPVLLGDGVRLFDGLGPIDLERTRTIDTPCATHLRFRVAG